MKKTQIILCLFYLITWFALSSLVINVQAQKRSKCTATVNNIYFVFADPGLTTGPAVTQVYPGRVGYYLYVRGTDANYFEVIKQKYMAVLSLESSTPTEAKWQVEFSPNMAQVISGINLTSKCTAETKLYKLDSKVSLSNQ
jgi:hypothetical protein